MENVDLAGFEDSLLGGSLSAFDDGFAYARKSPVEMTLLDAALTPLAICAGDRSWTTEPADVVQRTDRGAGLHWNLYVHAVSVVGLTGGNLLHTILDPITDSSKLQLVTPGAIWSRPSTLRSWSYRKSGMVICFTQRAHPTIRRWWSTSWFGGGEGVLVA